ncbi:MAG: ATP-binding protein [Patescibacteria group bacterium]|jgi:signal transduction histidine kinase
MEKIDIKLIQEFVLAAVALASLLLGFAVYHTNKRQPQNRYFFLTSLAVLLWASLGFLVYYPSLSRFSLLLARLNFASVALFLVSIYAFILNFPKNQARWRTVDLLFVSVGVSFAIVSAATNLIVADMNLSNSLLVWTMGEYELIFYAYAVITALLVIWRLVKSYKLASLNEKSQIRLFSYGVIAVAFFNTIFNVIWPVFRPGDNYYWLGDYSVVFMLGFTAYAITKHHLFDIKVIATEAIVIVLSLALLVRMVISESMTEGAINFFIWFTASYSGYQLVRSVQREIKQKEDISKLAKRLDEANKHLQDLDKAKDNFMSMASHELNTPIAAIEGYLSMILDEGMGGKIPDQAKKYLDSVYTSSKRLASLVRDLLNVSRIESNRVHLIYEESQMEDIINQAVMEVGSKVKEMRHTLVYDKSEDALPKTWFDKTRITEVVINMLGNSIKYTDPGGKIKVRAWKEGDNIVVSVKDNGCGVPKEKRDRIFQKFSQVDVLKDQVKGTGLGMYISKNLIELHKGKIWFESEGEGKGTEFFFSLPILKEKPLDEHEGEGAVLQLK